MVGEGGYRVMVKRKRGLRQQFHVLIVSGAPPYETIFTSENYANGTYAGKLAEDISKLVSDGSVGHIEAGEVGPT